MQVQFWGRSKLMPTILLSPVGLLLGELDNKSGPRQFGQAWKVLSIGVKGSYCDC